MRVKVNTVGAPIGDGKAVFDGPSDGLWARDSPTRHSMLQSPAIHPWVVKCLRAHEKRLAKRPGAFGFMQLSSDMYTELQWLFADAAGRRLSRLLNLTPLGALPAYSFLPSGSPRSHHNAEDVTS